VAAVLLPLLAALTFARCRVWKDDLTLWRDAIHKSPLKQRVAANYANALINRGRAAMAIAILESRLPVWDKVLPSIYALLGNAYAVEGNLEGAIENYRIAATHNPSDANTRFNLASAYHALGQRAKAINVLRVSLRYSPTDADTYLLLGLIYAEEPADRAKALDALTTYLRMVPAGPDAETARETISRLQSATAE
jgi:tetratricopeptide (TPR) repeat protein